MKLAEALQERADLNRRIEQLRNRLENSALVQEGERPAEAPEVLLEELRLLLRSADCNCRNISIHALLAESDF